MKRRVPWYLKPRKPPTPVSRDGYNFYPTCSESHINPLRSPPMGAKPSKVRAHPAQQLQECPPRQTPECPVHHACLRTKALSGNTPSPPPYAEKVAEKSPSPSGCTCRRPPWTNQHFARVASMPETHPLPGHKYLQLPGRHTLPVRYCSCPSCARIVPSTKKSRKREFESRQRRAVLERGDPAVETPAFELRTADGGRHEARVVYGLLPGDIQRPIALHSVDWTADWKWALEVQSWDSASHWRMDTTFYFNDLQSCSMRRKHNSARLRGDPTGHPTYFTDNVTACRWKLEMDVFDNAQPPRWCAAITLMHENPDVLVGADYQDYFGPKETYR